MRVIKVFGKTDSSYAKFEKATHDGAYCYIDWMRATITPFTAGLSITPATILSILPIGSFMFMSGGISAADFITIIILSIGMLLPLITVMSYFDDISKINVIFGEVADILGMKEMMTTMGKINFPQDYKGKWVILFSHPADFTPVCTTEFITFAKMSEEFKTINTELSLDRKSVV